MAGLITLGVGVTVVIGIGADIGVDLITSKAVDAIVRQPGADGKIIEALLLGCTLAKVTAIYGLVISLLIVLFLK